MLKNIPTTISPELLKVLSEMGHGDEIVLADGNFPSAQLNKNIIRYDSSDIRTLLKDILYLFPLDTYNDYQVYYMAVNEDDNYEPTVWSEYQNIFVESEEPHEIAYLERFEFYERAKNAFAIVATGDLALYANVILKKGVILKE